MPPAGKDGITLVARSDVNNQVDVGVVLVVGSACNLDELQHTQEGKGYLATLRAQSTRAPHVSHLVGELDVLGCGVDVFWRRHDEKLHHLLAAEGLVGPFADRANGLHGRDSVVRDKDLQFRAGAEAGLARCKRQGGEHGYDG